MLIYSCISLSFETEEQVYESYVTHVLMSLDKRTQEQVTSLMYFCRKKKYFAQENKYLVIMNFYLVLLAKVHKSVGFGRDYL